MCVISDKRRIEVGIAAVRSNMINSKMSINTTTMFRQIHYLATALHSSLRAATMALNWLFHNNNKTVSFLDAQERGFHSCGSGLLFPKALKLIKINAH